MKVIVELPSSGFISSVKLAVGRVGKIISGAYAGCHILRTYDGLVCLESPGQTWSKTADFKISLLPPGTKIILEMED